MNVRSKQKDGILVLGMDRSGTSMTSNLVQCWARYKGDPCKKEIADPSNPNGYFESPEIENTLTEAILHLVEEQSIPSWSPSFNSHLANLVKGNSDLANPLEHQFKGLRDVGVPWCSKTPLLSVTVAMWEHFVEDPVLVVTVRNPYDTAKSLLKFECNRVNRVGIAINLLRWQHYMVRILEDTAKYERRFFFGYEQAIENPESQIKKLGDFLGQQFPYNPDQENAVQEMLQIVEPKFHRNSSNISFEEREEATQTQKSLYALVQKIASQQAIPDAIDFEQYHLTRREIEFLEKHDIHVLPNFGFMYLFRQYANYFKFMMSRFTAVKPAMK